MSNEINSQNNNIEKKILPEAEPTEKKEVKKEVDTNAAESPAVKKETSASGSTGTKEKSEGATQNKPPYQRSGQYQRQGQQQRQGQHQRQGQYQRYPRFRRKVCRFCAEKDIKIDYKNAGILERFITDRGKILPRRVTGTCARHQRAIAREIKRARIIALVPYIEK